MENPSNPHIITALCAGEALIDLVALPNGQLSPCLGGAVYNLARALALQGVATGYLNPLSNDFYGTSLRDGLIANGVQILESHRVVEPTSLAIARLGAHGNVDYAFYRDGVADRQISADRLNALSNFTGNKATIACTGCLALSPYDAHAYLPWLAEQKRLQRLIAIDINIRSAIMKDTIAYKTNIDQALQYADIIKASDEDLAFLGTNAVDLFEQTHANIVLVTLGAQGAQLLTRGGECFTSQAPSGLQVIDTIGAGDCFFAGFLAYWLRHESQLQAALDHAVQSASISVQRQGCQPPTWAEIDAIKKL